MPSFNQSIYETKYCKARWDLEGGRGAAGPSLQKIIDLQTQHWDEIKQCLEEDEKYQLFIKERREYFQNQNPDFNDEKLNQYLL